jgi:WD40 repeat protein
LTFSPDGQTLACGGRKAIQLWDVATGEGRVPLASPAHTVPTLAFSPHGQVLASGGFQSQVQLWEVSGGTDLPPLTTSGEQVADLAFSPNGRLLAIAPDGTVELWDLAKRCLRARLVGHEGQVKCLAFSPTARAWRPAASTKPCASGTWNASAEPSSPLCLVGAPHAARLRAQ